MRERVEVRAIIGKEATPRKDICQKFMRADDSSTISNPSGA